MAIRLSTATLSEPFEYISLHDDALDTEREDFADEFQRYRDGQAPPPLKPGVEPTRWTLEPITDARLKAMLEGVREEHGRTMWFLATAAVGVTGVSGLSDERGRPFKLKRPRSSDGYPTMSHEQQDQIGAQILAELGMAIITHNIPSPS